MPNADMPAANPSIPYVDLRRQFDEEKDELLATVAKALERGDWVGGAAVAALEHELSEFHGVAETVCLNSGTDALFLAIRVLGIGAGDEVITPVNSFIASTATIVLAGARPVLVDVLDDQNLDPAAVAAAITPRTKAIMPVHLTGRMADMDKIAALAERHGLAIIEDAAQAIGSRYRGRLSGSIGDFGCFSAHPLKNLNACGDAGFLITQNSALAERIRQLRSHGLVDRNTVSEFGLVSRLDTLQASILSMRLKRLPSVIERRRANAKLYYELLDRSYVFLPPCRDYEFNTFHTFVIQVERRDALQRYLHEQGVGSAIHYPVPIHLQPAASELGYRQGDFPVAEEQAARILTLPINQFVTEADVHRIADAVNRFYRGK